MSLKDRVRKCFKVKPMPHVNLVSASIRGSVESNATSKVKLGIFRKSLLAWRRLYYDLLSRQY